MSETIYAIGDSHGCAVELVELLGKIAPRRGDTVVFLGDYIDRGPDSKGVVDIVRSYAPSGVKVVTLKGNHEDMMLQVSRNRSLSDWWLRNGGNTTLASYGGTIPADVLEWADKLPLKYAEGGYLFVHAGVDPDHPLDEQDEEALLWIRAKFLRSNKDYGVRIVHGHTPNDDPEVEPNRINVDTACCYGNKLTCAVLTKGEPFFISVAAHAAETHSAAQPSSLKPLRWDRTMNDVTPIDYTALDGPGLLNACGDSGERWAEAFQQIVMNQLITIDRDLMIGWFANAIEHSGDVRRWEREKAEGGSNVAMLCAPAESVGRDERQAEVAAWCAAAFGADHAASIPQRGIRHAEEAIEAAQAAGCEREMVLKLVDYVFDRPAGELRQEIGGSGLTLLALAQAAGFSADEAERVEIARVKAKPLDHFAKRNQVKNDAGFIVGTPSPPTQSGLSAAQTNSNTSPAPAPKTEAVEAATRLADDACNWFDLPNERLTDAEVHAYLVAKFSTYLTTRDNQIREIAITDCRRAVSVVAADASLPGTARDGAILAGKAIAAIRAKVSP